MDDELQAARPSTSVPCDDCANKCTSSATTTTLRRDYGDEAPSTSRLEAGPVDGTTAPVRCTPRVCRASQAADSRLRPSTAPLIGAFAVLNLLMTFGAANGYVVGRLLTLERDTFRPITAKNYVFAPGPRRSGNDGGTGEWTTEMTPEMMYEVLREMVADENVDGARRTRRAGRRRKSKRRVTAVYPASLAGSPRNDVAADSSDSAIAERNDERATTAPLDLLRRKFRRDLDSVTRTTQKKSVLKSLKKFGSNNVRNCFFTPIQCMIQHDMSKYKKLIENNSDGFTTTRI